jgi:hypothetical protein
VSIDTVELTPPNLIKMDIEGGESEALAGARAILAHHRPIVLVAFHGLDQESFCLSFLNSLGYRAFTLDGEVVGHRTMLDEVYALP